MLSMFCVCFSFLFAHYDVLLSFLYFSDCFRYLSVEACFAGLLFDIVLCMYIVIYYPQDMLF